jgi:iron complex outermembrane receptor protein
MGIKASFLQDRFYTSLSFYETTRKNQLEADPNDPTFTFEIPVGTVRIRGIEWEVTGRLTRDLDVPGGLSFMASEISDPESPFTLGREFHNVPNFQAGLRLRYDTSHWLIPGISLGGGVIYTGERPGDDVNSFYLPAYYRFDAGLYYHWRNWNFKLTCTNLLDKHYYLASQGIPDTITPGAPRLFTLGAPVTL